MLSKGGWPITPVVLAARGLPRDLLQRGARAQVREFFCDMSCSLVGSTYAIWNGVCRTNALAQRTYRRDTRGIRRWLARLCSNAPKHGTIR